MHTIRHVPLRSAPREMTRARETLWALTLIFLSACAPLPVQQPPAVETPSVEEPERPVTITVAAVGDIMLGTDFPTDRLPSDDGHSQLAAVRPWLEGADITFGNLEGVLMDGGEPVKQCTNPELCYLFRSPARFADALRAAGFDVMSLANNHAADFGEVGRDASMAALDAAGIRHSGRSGDIAAWEINGLRVALIAFAPNVGAYSLLDIEQAACRVSTLAATHDLVFVSFHGGAEGADALRVKPGMEFFHGEARGDLIAFAHRVIDAGADLVLGHGPHVPRALQLYQGRLIAYSLGNFATYYGISVSGDNGLAPVLHATLTADGAFLHGRIHSAVQQRPRGPLPDPRQRAFELMRKLTEDDFGGGNLLFQNDGGFLPKNSTFSSSTF